MGLAAYRKAGILLDVSTTGDPRPRPRPFVRPYRFIGVGLVVAFLIGVLSVRLWDLQLVQGIHYRTLAEDNRLLRLPVAADRGIIVDRNGKVLVRNIPGFAVSIVPVDLPKARESDVALRLAQLIGRNGEDVLKAVSDQRSRNPYEPVKLSTKPISRDVALLLAERAEVYPGVRIDAESVREYVEGPLYSPIIGYTGPITEDASGRTVPVKGAAYLVIHMNGQSADLSKENAPATYTGPTSIEAAGATRIQQVRRTGDFEAVLTWVIGLDKKRPFHVTTQDNPVRVVVDVGD